jgi:sugar lactone lactonase YvrE
MLIASITIPGNPSGLIKAFDNDDMIYTRYTGNTINRITPEGVITEISSAPELNGPVGLTYDEFGILYVGNYNDREIYRVEPNGDLTYIAKLPATGALPNLGFITYAQGRIFGTILGEHKIYSVDPNDTDSYLRFAGSVQGTMDGDISVATFDRPNGILANAAGDVLYVTDFGSKNLRIISDVILAAEDLKFDESSFVVFPNPAQDSISVQGILSEANFCNILVFDVLGKEIYKRHVQIEAASIFETIDSSSWNSGVYFIQLTSGNSSIMKRIIKH